MDRLESLFRSYTGIEADKCLKLSPGTDRDENRAFVTLARHFRSKGLRVPEVLSVSDDWMYYLQQDLGDRLLYDALAEAREAFARLNAAGMLTSMCSMVISTNYASSSTIVGSKLYLYGWFLYLINKV